MLDPRTVSISMDELVQQRPAGGPKAPRLHGHGEKVVNKVTEAQRFSSLPRRPAVNIEFKNVSYSVRDGPWWRKRGRPRPLLPQAFQGWIVAQGLVAFTKLTGAASIRVPLQECQGRPTRQVPEVLGVARVMGHIRVTSGHIRVTPVQPRLHGATQCAH